MYQLIIKCKDSIWRNADIGDNTIAMTYQANDIAELKDRQANYSQNIALPLTNTNKLIFGGCDEFSISTILPYRKFECRLMSDDFVLAGINSILIINSVDEKAFNCQILSGNADLFTTMSETKIEDITDREVLGSIIKGLNIPSNSLNWIKSAKCYVGEYNKEKKDDYFLFMNLYKTIERITNYFGYSIVSNLTEADKNSFFNLAGEKPMMPDSLSMFNARAESYGNKDTMTKQGLPAEATHGILKNFRLYVKNSGSGRLEAITTNDYDGEHYDTSNFDNFILGNKSYKVCYTSNIKGKIQLKLSYKIDCDVQYTNPAIFINTFYSKIQIYHAVISDGAIVEYEMQPFIQDTNNIFHWTYNKQFSKTIEIDVEVGSKINTMLAIYLPYGLKTYDFTAHIYNAIVEIKEIEAEDVPLGGKLFFQNNTGFDKCFDLFKAFVQTYGLTCYVDNINRQVYCYTFKQLYENKAKAKDWSSKFVLDQENQITFTLDNYGQINTLSFNEKDDYQDKGTFKVDNTTIEKDKELFSIKWESGQDFNSEAIIPLYEFSQEENSTELKKELKGTNPHLVSLNYSNTQVQDLTNGEYRTIKDYVAKHIKPQYLLDNYYKELINYMLVKAKKIEIYLLLNDKDMQDFEPFTPIYLSQLGYYFYVNKINNYISKKLTKVELIKL